MRNTILSKLLLSGVFAVTMVSCDDQETNKSVVTSFAKFTPELTAVTIAEVDGPQTIHVTFSDELQVTDMHVTIEVGSLSTATEGEDFELLTHEVDLLSFQGQDGFDIEIDVFDDMELDEEDEVIYLTLSTETPSGLDDTDVLVITVEGCVIPFETDLFVGDYQMTSTNDALGVPLFDDQVVTLVALGGGTRAFEAIYLEAFGVGNGAEEWILEFDCNDGLLHFEAQDTDLACSPTSIQLIPLAPFGTFNPLDDTQFTVVITELETDLVHPDNCGLDGTVPVTLTFTKL